MLSLECGKNRRLSKMVEGFDQKPLSLPAYVVRLDECGVTDVTGNAVKTQMNAAPKDEGKEANKHQKSVNHKMLKSTPTSVERRDSFNERTEALSSSHYRQKGPHSSKSKSAEDENSKTSETVFKNERGKMAAHGFSSQEKTENNGLCAVSPCSSLAGQTAEKPPAGFRNIGNSCYMNAVLQAVFCIPAFTSCLLSARRCLRKANVPDFAESTLASALYDLLYGQHVAFPKVMEAVLKKMRASVFCDRFRQHEQQDAHEFLVHVLTQLENEFSTFDVQLTGNVQKRLEAANPVRNAFSFKMKQILECKACGRKECLTDVLMDLKLQIPEELSDESEACCSKQTTIQDLIEAVLSNESLEHRCEQCSTSDAECFQCFEAFPKLLVLVLKRYVYDKDSGREIKWLGHVQPSLDVRIRQNRALNRMSCCSKDNTLNRTRKSSQSHSSNSISIVRETPLLISQPSAIVQRLVRHSNSFQQHSTKVLTCISDVVTPGSRKRKSISDSMKEEAVEVASNAEKEGSSKRRLPDRKAKKQSWAELDDEEEDSIEVIESKTEDMLPFHTPTVLFRKKACSVFGLKEVKNSIFDATSETIWVSISCLPAKTHDVAPDGNCLFRALSFCFTGGSEEDHAKIRAKVTDFQMAYGHKFRLLYGMSSLEWKNYVEDMTCDGVWGSDREIHAAATMLDADIWTFYLGRWLVYSPRFLFDEKGNAFDIPYGKVQRLNRSAIYLLNDNEHYEPVIDVLNNRAADYRLFSMICHCGTSTSAGHYVCNVWNRAKKIWFHCNDDKVSQVCEEKVMKQGAKAGYIFIYQKVER